MADHCETPYDEKMTNTMKGSQAIDRALKLMLALVDARGEKSLGEIARGLSLTQSTAHRMVAALEANGLVVRTARGRYRGGAALARSASAIDANDLLVRAARPVLRALSDETGRTAHLGVFEADMVTYLVRESPPGERLFTRESMQLEAYCSGIGKVLLASLSEGPREYYLAQGQFVALTERTLTDPAAIRAHLAEVAIAGHAVDDEEVEQGLYCLAVPLHTPDGLPLAALSLAGSCLTPLEKMNLLNELTRCAADVERLLLDATARIS